MNGEVDEAGEQGGSRPKHTHHCGSSRGPSAASGGFERRGRGQRLCTAQPLGQRHRSPAPPHMKPPPGGMPGCRKSPPVSASSTLCTKGSPPAAPPKPAGMPGMPGMPKPGMAPPPPPPMSPGPATGGGGGGGGARERPGPPRRPPPAPRGGRPGRGGGRGGGGGAGQRIASGQAQSIIVTLPTFVQPVCRPAMREMACASRCARGSPHLPRRWCRDRRQGG